MPIGSKKMHKHKNEQYRNYLKSPAGQIHLEQIKSRLQSQKWIGLYGLWPEMGVPGVDYWTANKVLRGDGHLPKSWDKGSDVKSHRTVVAEDTFEEIDAKILRIEQKQHSAKSRAAKERLKKIEGDLVRQLDNILGVN